MTDYSELVKRLRELGNHASFEPSAYHEAADAIQALTAERDRARADALEWRKAFHSVTPGGSEYMAPEKCVEFVRRDREDRLEFIKKTVRDCKDAQARVMELEAEFSPKPTHRHIKSGGDYELIGYGRVQSSVPLNDMQEVAIYRSAHDGSLWARERKEFNDVSRFRPLHAKAALEVKP